MPKNSKLLEGISSSFKRVQGFVSKFVAPYLVPAVVIYGCIKLFRIPLDKKVFMMVGTTILWIVYILVIIFLAIRIKGQADMHKTQQKLKSLSGRRVATEIEAFIQEVLPITFDVLVKLGFAIGLLYLHLLNEKRKWVVYSDRLIIILLIVVGVLLVFIYFSIAFYVSKIDVEVVKNASKEKAKKKNIAEDTEEEKHEEIPAPEQIKRPTAGYHPYFDPKLEGSINYGLKPTDPGWEDYATSKFNPHPSNPNRESNPVISKDMQEFMSRYAKGEVKGLSEEIVNPKEQNHTESEKNVISLNSIPIEKEVNEKNVGEQPDRFSGKLLINEEHWKKVQEQRKTS